ncbi:MAG: hypothetical protein OHK0053_14750 [Microscillaceae bacterium]
MRTVLSVLFFLITQIAFAQFAPSDLFTYSENYGYSKKTLFFQKGYESDNSYQFTISVSGECNETLQGTIITYDGIAWQTDETSEIPLKFTFGGGAFNQPYPMCVIEILYGEDKLCSVTGTYIGEVYPTVQPNYAGKIGNYPIEMYLGDTHIVGTGRFTLQHGYYYYNSQKQPIYIRANGYFGNAMGQGGGLSISELDYEGEEQAIFEITQSTETGFSGTWKSTRNNSTHTFYLYKK